MTPGMVARSRHLQPEAVAEALGIDRSTSRAHHTCRNCHRARGAARGTGRAAAALAGATMTETLLALLPAWGPWLLAATTFLSCLMLPIPASMLMLAGGALGGHGRSVADLRLRRGRWQAR